MYFEMNLSICIRFDVT